MATEAGISIALYKLLLDNSSDPIFCFDRTGRYVYVNNAFAAPFHVSPGQIIGQRIWDVFPGEEGDYRYATVKQVFETGERAEIDVKVQVGDTLLYLITTAIPVCGEDGQVQNVICISKDITARKLAEDALKESERRLLAAQAMAHVGSWELNLADHTVWASPEAYRIYGIPYCSEPLDLEQVQAAVLPEYRPALDAALRLVVERNGSYDVEFQIRDATTGEVRFVHSRAALIGDEAGGSLRVVGAIQDVTEQKRREAEVLYLSYHDQLTGLYNRRFYEQELVRLDVPANLPLTIVMGDVNGLKQVNDRLGHTTGDQLLQLAATVLTEGFRPTDIVARLGGDEFVVIMPQTAATEALAIVERISLAAGAAEVGGFSLSISFGLASKQLPKESVQEVFTRAENAMYRQKADPISRSRYSGRSDISLPS